MAQWATGGVCDAHVDGLCTVESLQTDATIYDFNGNGVCEDSGRRFEFTGVDSVGQDTFFMCEFRGGNTIDAYCTRRLTSGGIVHGGLDYWYYPCSHGTDCSDCGPRCGTGSMAPIGASLEGVVNLVPSYKVMFIPSSLSIGHSQTRRVVIQLREALETNAFTRLSFSTTVPGLSISPSSVEWTASQNYTTGRSILITSSQPITANLADAITVTVNTTDTSYAGFSPTFAVATITTPSPLPAPPPSPPPPSPPWVTTYVCQTVDSYQTGQDMNTLTATNNLKTAMVNMLPGVVNTWDVSVLVTSTNGYTNNNAEVCVKTNDYSHLANVLAEVASTSFRNSFPAMYGSTLAMGAHTSTTTPPAIPSPPNTPPVHPPPATVCASNTDSNNAFAVSVVSGSYQLDGSLSSHNVGANAYHFANIPSGHPMKIWQDDGAAGCTVTLASCQNVISTDYCWGTASWSVSAGCAGQSLSLRCAYHGAMGGTDRLIYSSEC